MKFSRNPSNGRIECYSDNGLFLGNVVTMGDLTENGFAEDGGPGSGNFGHAGRPGKVGGSAPGSGKGSGSLYRHEKKGVGFFGTRRDWLNGLEGEEQHKAARFVAQKKREMNEAFKKKETIEKLWKDGHLTRSEADERLKEMGILDLDENSPVEKYILKKGDEKDVHELFSHADTARNWPENHEKFLNNNLSEEERKVWEYYCGKSEQKEARKIWQNLHAKALGLPHEDVGIPDEYLYESGAKERPKPAKGEPDYGWYAEKRKNIASSLEGYMGNVMGTPMWGKGSSEEFAKVNKKFVDCMKYERLSPIKCQYALKAMDAMRDVIGATKDERYGYWTTFGTKLTKEMIDRLDKSEQDQLLDMVNMLVGNRFSPEGGFKNLEDIKHEDFYTAERAMTNMSLRKASEQQIVRDYVLLMEKALTGEVPSEENPVEKRKEEKKEAEKRKREEWVAKRDSEQEEFRKSPEAQKKRESIQKIRAITKDSVSNLTARECINLVKESGIMKDGREFVTSPLIPDECYRSAVLAYRNVIDKYPFLAGEFGGFGDNASGSRGTIAGCDKRSYDESDSEITINYNYFRDPAKLKEIKKESMEKNWHVKVDDDLPDGYADYMHEIGHAFANWMHRYTKGAFVGVARNSGSPWLGKFYDNDVATTLKKRTLKACGISTYQEIKQEVSEYAAASRLNKGPGENKCNTIADEFFAECFCELMCSSKPRRVAVEFGKQLEKFMKENGIGDELLTCKTEANKPVLE